MSSKAAISKLHLWYSDVVMRLLLLSSITNGILTNAMPQVLAHLVPRYVCRPNYAIRAGYLRTKNEQKLLQLSRFTDAFVSEAHCLQRHRVDDITAIEHVHGPSHHLRDALP